MGQDATGLAPGEDATKEAKKQDDAVLDEYKDLTDEEKQAIKRHRDALEESEEFVRPYFERALRYDNLYNNVLPEELDCTYSKCMLPIAFSMVQNDIPRTASTLLSTDDFLSLDATEPRRMFAANAATNWLSYIALKRNRLFPRIIPTLQSVGVRGTGYRLVSHAPVQRHEMVSVPQGTVAGVPYGFRERERKWTELRILSQDLDFYRVLPAPNGGIVNPSDPDSEEGVEWLHVIRYMSARKLKAMRKQRGANKKMIDKMLSAPQRTRVSSSGEKIDQEFTARSASKLTGVESPAWISRTHQNEVEDRYRVVITFFRDQWVMIGEDKYPIYTGPPLLDWIPVSRYVDTPNYTEWFGRSLVEVTEDIILAYLLTYNFRMDYLTSTMHPTKFIRQDIVKANKGELNDFDPSPYGLFTFSQRVKNIQNAVWYDRFPEISPQAFMEETAFKQLLQESVGQPSYSKGMGGSGALANETATGIVSLIEEGSARSAMRALTLEHTGLHDELMLMLKYGKKYVWEDPYVQVRDDSGKTEWRMIDHDAIDDGYGIELKGTRSIAHKNEVVKRMMSILPMLINNPNVPGQTELLRETMQKVGGYTNIEGILSELSTPDGTISPAIGGAPRAALGAGTPTTQNEVRSVGAAMPQARQQSELRFAR